MEKKVLLTKNKSKTNANEDNIIYLHLEKNGKLLPYDDIEANVNLLDVYNSERNSSNKIRLTCQINPICTNVLFNNITEVVKYNGSDSCISLNYEDNVKEKETIGKISSFSWNQQEAIRDTQLSNSACGYDYYCGMDIFNNHIIRNNTFKCSISTGKSNNYFNTLFDDLKDDKGNIIHGYKINNPNEKINLHLYLKEEVDDFNTSIKNNLVEQNGWFGFINSSKITTLKTTDNNYNLLHEYNKPINNKEACDFIEMYPDSSLYSFNPKYNEYRNRIEKNWNYCLTYPSSSTTDGFEFINSSIDSLNILYFIEKDDIIRFYSISKHNLKLGDYVNIYNNSELLLENKMITSLGNDNGENKEFIFNVSSDGDIITNHWHQITSGEYMADKVEISGLTLTIKNNKIAYDDNHTYYIVEKNIHIDDDLNNLSFKKLVNGEEVDYYVRIFSKIPNWKYADKEVNEYNIYDNPSTSALMRSCQISSADFESHITKMAFARNIYNDSISQIVFNDNIDISYLKDNLNRPLTDIYLTIVKNNKGYEQWYGKDNQSINITDENIEFSHCFGKLTCAFELSKYSMVNSSYKNLLLLNNINNTSKNFHMVKGYDINKINDAETFDDEIKYSGCTNFYGDLCEYSHINQSESSIQMIGFRFNTAQRELDNSFKSYQFFSKLNYDEILTDDYDYDGYVTTSYTYDNVCEEREGYYYHPHFKIPINMLSNTVETGFPLIRKVSKIKNNGNDLFSILTSYSHELNNNDKFTLFDSYHSQYYSGTVLTDGIINSNLFKAKIDSNFSLNKNIKIEYLQVLNPMNSNIPSYANLLRDGSARYIWREVLHNGDDTFTNVETYPFANGNLYVNSNINLYLLRQDSKYDSRKYTINGGSLVYMNDNLLSPSGNTINSQSTNNYNTSSAMTC